MPYDRPDYQPISTPTLPDIGEGQVLWFQSENVEVAGPGEENLISYIVPDGYELRVCSGIVSCEAPRTQRFNFITTPAGDWVSPTSHIDPDNKWFFEELAYDSNLASDASPLVPAHSWSSWLELLVNEATIDKVRFYARYDPLQQSSIDIKAFYGGIWNAVYTGAYADREWVEKDLLPGVHSVSKAEVRVYNNDDEPRGLQLFEFMFNTSGESPQETIYFDTYAIIPYLPEAPYPVPAGATFVVRVYNDDDIAQRFSVNLAGFLQAKV